jgi:hypothetical protein
LLVGTGAEWAADGIVRDGAIAASSGDAAGAVRDDIVRRARTVEQELRATAASVATMSTAIAHDTDAPPSDEDDVRVAPDEQLAADLTRCVQEGGELPVDLLWSREWILHVERVLHVPSLTRSTG